ncbi:ccr4 associated factor [Coemansia sp. BCRC 34490]|nr:ccr4 associated factor [Coemansia sp. BCRC 34490]
MSSSSSSSSSMAATDLAIRVERATDFETALDQHNQYAQVPQRAVIEVSGTDAAEFLQGMQCNDMSAIDQGSGGMVTGFLAPQGRMVADAFVYRRRTSNNRDAGSVAHPPAFLVEVDQRVKERLLKTLQFYKLRAKITLRDATDEYGVWSVWGPDSAALADTPAAVDAWLADRRAPGMGLRLVATADQIRALVATRFARVAGERYTLRRVLKGVAEGASDFVAGAAVPLECNLDYMQGVHFGKGCYVGQELTIRTHHRGVVRKRIVPALLSRKGDGGGAALAIDPAFGPEQAPAPQTDIAYVTAEPDDPQRAPSARLRRPPGRMATTALNAALTLVRLDLVGPHVTLETVGADGQRLVVTPWTPSWWPQAPH